MVINWRYLNTSTSMDMAPTGTNTSFLYDENTLWANMTTTSTVPKDAYEADVGVAFHIGDSSTAVDFYVDNANTEGAGITEFSNA